MANAPKPKAEAPEEPGPPAGPDERDLVIAWRFHALREANYPDELASRIAARLDIDLHTATDMAEHGCDFKTAGKILL